MQLKSFDGFLKGLHDEIVRLEFSHYDFKKRVNASALLVLQDLCNVRHTMHACHNVVYVASCNSALGSFPPQIQEAGEGCCSFCTAAFV